MRCENCGSELPNGALFCDNCGKKVEAKPKKFCGNCGAEMDADAAFCGECGASVSSTPDAQINYVFCGNCGAKIPENSQTCPNCGYTQNAQTEKNEKSEKNPRKKHTAAVIAVLTAVILILAGIIGGYIFYNSNNGSEESEPSASPQVSQMPTASPEQKQNNAAKLVTYYVVNCNSAISLREAPSSSATVLKEIPLGSPVSYVEAAENGFAKVIFEGTTGYALQAYLSMNASDVKMPSTSNSSANSTQKSSVGVVSNPSYTVYRDSDYNFSCSYPSHFQVYNENNNFVRYSLKAPDNTATLKICATSNSSQLSAKNVSDNFKSSYPGTVDYENSGNNWCAVCTIKDGQCHYAYYHVDGNSIRGFEMHYAQKYYSTYDKYVNDIYNSLKYN